MKTIFWPAYNPAHGKRWPTDADLLREMDRREAREWRRGVMCVWERRAGWTAQLQPVEAGADFDEEIGEAWACLLCGRVTRNPRNSQAPAGPVIRHYTHCTDANWITCRPSSTALGFSIEYCDGVDVRRWRCATCRREYTDAEAIRFADEPTSRRDYLLHRRTCAHRLVHSRAAKAEEQRMRNREALEVSDAG